MAKNIDPLEFNFPVKTIYEQRFEMLMKLIRIDRMLRSAKIIHNDKGRKNDGYPR